MYIYHLISIDLQSSCSFNTHTAKAYKEAEGLYRQVVQGREKVLGKEYALKSKYQLANSLYQQRKYQEAEELCRQVVQGQEKVLGKEHADTLRSKYRLANSLYEQQKYQEAEGLYRQVVQGQEKVLGKEHADTLKSKLWLQKTLAICPRAIVNNTTNTPVQRLGDFFLVGEELRDPYNDLEINQISSLLKYSNPRWGQVPRTYTILRIIGRLNLLDNFIDLGFSDHWFPVTERTLPHRLSPSLRSKFVNTQNLVLTKSMDPERGEKGQHCYFQRNEAPPFERKEVLGSGGFGQVDRVLSLISFKEYARKQVPRSSAFSRRRMQDMKLFIAEIEILKRLKHRHVVEFVGSYTDSRYIGLIISPVAEMDLSTYLARINRSKYPELRTFFGCLARALEFLHEQNIRHKDIKPGNILVDRGSVLFTDFGLSHDFTDADGSTTASMVNGMTPRYCAPEVAMQEPRNTSSDIWSMGVVFLEMIVILKGETAGYLNKFFNEHGSQQAFVRTNPDALYELIAELEEKGTTSDNKALVWIQHMLLIERQLRPTAASLIASITLASKDSEESASFCGICCLSPDDDFSDAIDELEDGP
ncbi:kinase-like protein [Cenococcum geophilum 1.58]|uniref:kinase-like protein n=1 Tax=Cenococcum geophilum 1.58 TaxID=794803 RepID=UPI00358F51B5|nr:kinase-like protein [Cenococcum geophilum 1.58]